MKEVRQPGSETDKRGTEKKADSHSESTAPRRESIRWVSVPKR